MMKNKPLYILIGIFILLSMVTTGLWKIKGINGVTGDEPHYLVMADGLVKYGSFEQSRPYKDEFLNRKIYKGGLAQKDATPSAENTHAVLGAHGLFNVHNVGLPLLLAVPFLLGGKVGAKVLMILLTSGIVFVTWRLAEKFIANDSEKIVVTILCCFSASLIPASSQIYPDVPAGLISLLGVYWFLTLEKVRSIRQEILLATLVAFLPWLQIKFALTSFILVLAIAGKSHYMTKDAMRARMVILVAAISCLLLAAYNYYAFGKVSGPYQSGALEISRTSLMVLWGLISDQNQGFLFQNPLFFMGLMGVGLLYHEERLTAATWALVFLSLLVPNGMHPNWYGGGSFSGRFEISGAIVFILPTIVGFARILKMRSRSGRTFIAALGLLQMYFFIVYAIYGVSLYNKDASTWPGSYSIYYSPVDGYLPLLYNSNWAYGWLQNYVWLSVIVTLFGYGFLRRRIKPGLRVVTVFSLLLLVVAAGVFRSSPSLEKAFSAADLPSQTGAVEGTSRVVHAGVDRPGFINFGPYFSLGKGSYEVSLTYSSNAAVEKTWWFLIFSTAKSRLQCLI